MTNQDEASSPGHENSQTRPAEAGPTRAQRGEPRDHCSDRARIHVTNILPYTLIGQLIVTFPSTSRMEPVSYCSGFLLDERHVLTAAHNLYNPRRGVWAYSVGFQPAKDGSATHYPSVAGLKEPSRVIPSDVKEFIVKYYGGELRYLKAPPHDYCVLELSKAVVPKVEWLALSAPTDGELAAVTHQGSRQINITGYPDETNPSHPPHPGDVPPPDTPSGTMWGQSGPLSGYSDSLLFYDICATGGQSGAPILMNLTGEPHDWLIVGIHLFSGRPANVGLRFTGEIVRDIQRQVPIVKIRSVPETAYEKVGGKETMQDTQKTIRWEDADGGLKVTADVFGAATFSVEVYVPEQVKDWDHVLGVQAPFSDEAAVSASLTNGGQELTIAVVREALNHIPIIALAGVVAYAISRRYRIVGRRTGDGWSFEFAPPR